MQDFLCEDRAFIYREKNTKVQMIHSARFFSCVQQPNKTRDHRVQNSNLGGRLQVLWQRHSSTVSHDL